MKKVPMGNKGLSKLPSKVRNKMGYMKDGGKVKKGKFKIGDSVTATIDSHKRQLIKCNHSSTHLLHASLRKILGNHVSQKGSLVNSEKLRFDFSNNEPITSDNIIKIENFVQKVNTDNQIQ